MNIYESINEFKSRSNVVLTIGTFDGVHLGHQSIISNLNSYAKEINGESVLLTFHPHPRHILFPDDNKMRLLTTILERSRLLDRFKLHHLIIQEFTSDFSRINPIHFVRDILVNKLNVHTLVIGYDHHFGRNRQGSYEELINLSKIYDFNLKRIGEKQVNDVTISSTKIRNLLLEGEVDRASKLLGYNYTFSGKVIHGDKLARTIGFSTANIQIDDLKILPKSGVYVVGVHVNSDCFHGMLNISIDTYKTEVHIFDFNKNIYDLEISIEIISFLRDGRKMRDNEDLKHQLELDQLRSRSMLGLVN